jgi:RNA polymerase sigma-70 factor (ECF subfamily)
MPSADGDPRHLTDSRSARRSAGLRLGCTGTRGARDESATGRARGALPAIGERSDEELARACRGGDEAAWVLLVERFSRYVYAITTRVYRLSETDAEDVFQEVFARTFEHLGRLRSDSAIRPWIGQLTRRLAIDRLRLASRESLWDETFDLIEDRAGREFDQIELAVGVQAALSTLTDDCQEILDRFFAQDQTYREIAAALELPMGTIASRISRCLVKLRAELGDSVG